MAQTRATGRAFRNRFGQIAKLAGYSATPYEEMAGLTKDDLDVLGNKEIKIQTNDLTKLQKEKLRSIYEESSTNGEAAQILRFKDAGIQCTKAVEGFRKVNKDNFKDVVKAFTDAEA